MTVATQDTPWMTQAEAAAYLKVSRWTVQEYVRLGLKKYGTGKQQRFLRDDLDQFMKNRP